MVHQDVGRDGVQQAGADAATTPLGADMQVVEVRPPARVIVREREGKAHSNAVEEREEAELLRCGMIEVRVPLRLALADDVAVEVFIAQDAPIRIAPTLGV